MKQGGLFCLCSDKKTQNSVTTE